MTIGTMNATRVTKNPPAPRSSFVPEPMAIAPTAVPITNSATIADVIAVIQRRYLGTAES